MRVNSCNRGSNTNWRVNWIDWVICSPASDNQGRLFDEYQIRKLFPLLCSCRQVLDRGTKEFLWQSPLAITRQGSDSAISIWRQMYYPALLRLVSIQYSLTRKEIIFITKFILSVHFMKRYWHGPFQEMSGETGQTVRNESSFRSTPFVTRTVRIGDKLWTRKPKTITNKHAFLQFHHFRRSAGDSTLTLQSFNRLASGHFNLETRNISFFKLCWLLPTFADSFGFVQELCIEHAGEANGHATETGRTILFSFGVHFLFTRKIPSCWWLWFLCYWSQKCWMKWNLQPIRFTDLTQEDFLMSL